MKSMLSIWLLLMFLTSCNPGNKISGWEFENLNNEVVNLQTIEKDKLTVFYFLAPECPLSQNYTKEINEIYSEFKQNDVGFYAVFSGTVYSEDEMQSYVDEYDIQIIGLKDTQYRLAKFFNATITPEVFVIDTQGNIIYSGKIDNWIESLGVKRQVVTEFYLKNAINQFLEGVPVQTTKTEAVGCVLE